MAALVERLGLAPGTRALVVSCDDLGFSHEANTAIYGALRSGAATSASLMVPGPWARAAAAEYRGEAVGVHLVLNAELDLYRWGPITHSPSLLDGDGAFPRTVDDVWEHADLDEVRREWRAQLERAVLWGIGVDHLDAHLGGVELKPEFFDVYLDLAEEYHLPVRLPGPDAERRLGFPFRELAHERGIVSPDRAVAMSALGTTVAEIRAAVAGLPEGVTEVYLRPALDSPALRYAAPDWAERVREAELLAEGALTVVGGTAVAISYRVLAQLMGR
ncbi:MAG TPA: ChbG/HpnK family deacetylase [Acidimicrobiales bacterium]|nr:ChbG/HpnK family deacetylase [Acidimicrobiales bacterium]